MAYATVTYPNQTGLTTSYSIPFEYLEEDHITVTVDGVSTPFTFTSAYVANISPAPTGDVTIKRTQTIDEKVTTFSDGSGFLAEQANFQNDQLLFAVQEAADVAESAIRVNDEGTEADAQGAVIKNVGTPVDNTDAATKAYVDTGVLVHVAAAQTARTGAEAAEANAAAALSDAQAVLAATLVAKAAAETAEANSEAAEVNSEAAQVAAEVARDSAIAAVGGVKVTTGDTVAEPLDGKVSVAGLLTKTVTSPGTDETLSLSVPVASQAEAEAGVVIDKAMTPERTKQAIIALAPTAPLQSQIDTLKTNLAMTIIRLIANAGSSYMGMVDGWADEFEDTTGISSLGTATYDTSGDYIHNPATYGTDVCTGGTAIASSNQGGSFVSASSFDDNNGTYWAGNEGPSNVNGNAWIGYDLGSGVIKDVTQILLRQDQPSNVVTSVKVRYSDNGSTWTVVTTAAVVQGVNTLTFASAGAHRYWSLLANSAAGGGVGNWCVEEVSMHEALQAPNVTVASITKTADASPTQARVTLVLDPQVAVAYGTDNRIRISRDGGTTWVTGTMTTEAVNLDFPGGYTVDAVTASFDFTGTPSGTSMKLEWATFNNKHQLLHAWYPEWKV